jgi:hypothetical protein
LKLHHSFVNTLYIDVVINWRQPEDTVVVCVKTLYLSSFI